MAVDVVADRFNFFIVFICWDVHNKGRVLVISGRHTVLILFAQGNGVDDLIKDFSVASKFTSGSNVHLLCVLKCLSVPLPRKPPLLRGPRPHFNTVFGR